ncbi:kelch repeat-containing protein [Corallococcus sp. AS-1-6]|uniref:Kelch repeat-containing protein n=1 Tax=Corallococcus sp. AS-1-6 TaxID=2874599 RepID=UPI001CBEAA17|nr:kelch repeat-containing protein [Corallococcus sp. AS-1-6]MBZ4374167.1 hypothetical protein [Corallococcus sp. AS-1-6]
MSMARTGLAMARLPDGRVLASGGCGATTCTASAELYDPATGTWTATGAMLRMRAGHKLVALQDGRVLALGGVWWPLGHWGGGDTDTELYNPATGTWSFAGTLSHGRDSFTVTLLDNGRVLVVGGEWAYSPDETVEEFNPTAPSDIAWTQVASLPGGRYAHSTTKLPDGSVLVVGGTDGDGLIRDDAQRYHPSTGTWTAAPGLLQGRYGHSAVALSNGRVMVFGGWVWGWNEWGEETQIPADSVDVFDPATGTWRWGNPLALRSEGIAVPLPGGQVLVASGHHNFDYTVTAHAEAWSWTMGPSAAGTSMQRSGAAAVLLLDGRVLVAGGYRNGALAACELFTPASSFGPAVRDWVYGAHPLRRSRAQASAVVLPSGKVLVAGGLSNEDHLASAELYDPATGTWELTGAMATRRSKPTLVLLSTGKVLAVGGANEEALHTAELYDPAVGTWTAVPDPVVGRTEATVTALPSGHLLVTGGQTLAGVTVNTVERVDPLTGTRTVLGGLQKVRRGHQALLLPSGRVAVWGGTRPDNNQETQAELYDPATGTSSAAGTVPVWGSEGVALRSATVLLTGGTSASGVVAPMLWNPVTGTLSPAGTLAEPRVQHRALLLPDGRVLVVGGYAPTTFGAVLDSAELYDPATNTWSAAGKLGTRRSLFTAVTLASGQPLIIGGASAARVLDSAELLPLGAWRTVQPLTTARYSHTATRLGSGKVLVAGGIRDSSSALATAEEYDPTADTWSPTPAMPVARFSHTAVSLDGNRVMVTGGMASTDVVLASSLIYDATARTWAGTSAMSAPRLLHTATRLPDGKVLVVGGHDGINVFASAELYDPATDLWTSTGALANARFGHTATLLANGKVLVVGGQDVDPVLGYPVPMATAELYDPATNTWSAAGALASPRAFHAVVSLPTGAVLVSGGHDGADYTATAERYDPVTNTWSVTGAMGTPRDGHALHLLSSGKVLALGGYDGMALTRVTELYDPATGTWTPTGLLSTPRYNQATTALATGDILVAGGYLSPSAQNATVELYRP